MAHVLKDFDFASSRRMRYPWNKWLDGRIWELEHGKDFLVPPEQMRRNIYNAGWSRGIAVRTSITGETLVMQAFRSSKGKQKEEAA